MVHERVYKILLVDDDLNCLDAIEQILRRDGYDVIPIDAGRSALELLSKNSFDLAIVDLNLPDIDGLHVLHEIRKNYKSIPTIIMTSEPSKEVRLASLEAGAYSFITKPINIPIFRNIITKAIQSSRLRSMDVRRELIFIKWFRGFIHK